MIMVKAVIRPEKTDEAMAALMDAGFPAVTKMSVAGRGKQRGIKIGDITYDELPKEMLIIVANDGDKDFIVRTVISASRSSEKGSYGDGKIFILPVEEMYTVSSGIRETKIGEPLEAIV